MAPKLLIVGPNPSWQRVMEFDFFSAGTVNRAREVHFFASGKGVNAARAARCWGRSDAAVIQFAGGDNGRRLQSFLKGEGIAQFSVRTSASVTRCCTTCVDAFGGMTELIEPNGAFTDAELCRFMARFRRLVPMFDGVIVCGTAPGGRGADFFRSLAGKLSGRGLPVLLDGFSGVEALLASGCVTALKVNRVELEAIAGRSGEPAALLAAIRREYGLAQAAFTDGANAAWLALPDGLRSFRPPPVGVVNPVGSGDTCNAVFFSELLAGTAPEQAFRLGLGAAGANCLSIRCGEFGRDAATALAARVEVRKI